MADKPIVGPIVGIDISREWLDLCASPAAEVERIANTPEAVAAWLERTAPGLLAFEPTDGCARFVSAAARAASRLSGSTPTTSSPSAAAVASRPRPTRSTPDCCWLLPATAGPPRVALQRARRRAAARAGGSPP